MVGTFDAVATTLETTFSASLLVMHSGLMEQGFRVDVDGLRVLHRVGVEATDRAAWVGLLEELQALVEIVLEEREREDE